MCEVFFVEPDETVEQALARFGLDNETICYILELIYRKGNKYSEFIYALNRIMVDLYDTAIVLSDSDMSQQKRVNMKLF